MGLPAAATLRDELEAEWANAEDDLPFNPRASPTKVAALLTELSRLAPPLDRALLRERAAQWLRFAQWSNDDTEGVAQARDALARFSSPSASAEPARESALSAASREHR